MARFGHRSKKASNKKSPSGSVNQSQSVSTFGVGSLFEIRSQRKGRTRTASVIINGLDNWPAQKMESVPEPDLCAMLNISELKAPPADDQSIPASRFPEWLVCNKCNTLGKVGVHFEEQPDGIPTCLGNCSGWGIPTRILTVCWHKENGDGACAGGHIDDFPWVYWAHKGKEPDDVTCTQPQLELITLKGKTGLDGLKVRCRTCGKENSLKGALGETALAGLTCSGKQPWLYSRRDESGCQNSIRGLLRGASNVYFPVNAATISIPPNSSKLMQLLQSTAFRKITDNVINGKLAADTAADMMADDPAFASYDKDKIEAALQQLCQHHTASSNEQERRKNERDALIVTYPEEQCEDISEEEFETEVLEQEDIADTTYKLSQFIERISLVHRLREVRALRGFTRLQNNLTANSYSAACAPLSHGKLNWLPAVQNRGEGIYIELSRDQLKAWENKEAVKQRIAIIRNNYLKVNSDKTDTSDLLTISPAFMLIHTLSHLLIKQLSLNCGYSSASLRERIYYDKNYAGVLIYTASTAADGTLGGLVRQGSPDNLEETLMAAVSNARWCSSDPLCIDSEGQGTDALNLAACHACALVSETSCEYRNLFLDRALIVGTPEQPEIGFMNT